VVLQALEEAGDIDVLAIVHAESASGILNPLEEIVALAKARGILTVVDAVASIGGHALPVDALGIDIAVIGPQKSLAGPAGISAISVSEKAWQSLLHDYAPLGSMLSLLDQKRQWLEIGRGALPGTPPALEFFALEAALDRLEAEGVAAAVTRHAAAADATHEALKALGVHLWVPRNQSSALVTAVRLPDGIAAAPLLVLAKRDGADLSAGVGPGAARLVRLNHTGQRASQQAVAANIEALGEALLASGQRVDLPAALEAVETVYRQNPAKL
jgi:aspartate aminotransferase-like enzyme